VGRADVLECLTTRTELFGPSAIIRVRNASPGAATPVVSASARNVTTGVSVTFSPGDTNATSDDTWTVKYQAGTINFEQTYSGLTASSDVLTRYRAAGATQNGLNSSFFLFDFDTALTGALNYVTLAAYERNIGTDGAELAFMPIGLRTAGSAMPTTGSAQFRGATRGLYVSSAGELFGTTSALRMTANFESGAISGQTSNFKFQNGNGALATRTELLDFVFSGRIDQANARFSGTALTGSLSGGGIGISGTVEGTFNGPTSAPATEAALTYALGNAGSGAYMLGGGVMGRTP
jgi:hypothetical protein